MKRTFLAIAILLCASLLGHAAELTSMLGRADGLATNAARPGPVAKPWAHEGSDLRADTKAIWGKLDNGLRYVIYPTKQAPTKASLRMYMDVGSLWETEQERGIAHFLEHMAFESSKQFPTGEKFEYLQRLGMSTAADVNAVTNFDSTVYKLDLPRANEEVTDDALKMFRDFFDGALLTDKEIEKERAIVLNEIFAKDSAGYRAIGPIFNYALPETLIARRMPVSDMPHVKALRRQQFVDFYESWYTPGRAVIVAAGDFDVKMVERLIRSTFKDVTARRGENSNPVFGKATSGSGLSARFHFDRDLPVVKVELCVAAAPSAKPDCLERQREETVGLLANMMLNRRFSKIVKSEHAAVQSASIGTASLFHLAEMTELVATCEPQNWQAAVATFDQELRRATQYGFAESELAEVKAMVLAGMQSDAQHASTREPASLANDIVQSLIKREVFMDPTDALEMVKTIFAEIKASDCREALHQLWNTPDIKIWMQGNLKLEGDGTQQLLAAYRASHEQPVAAPIERVVGKFAYTDFGPAGHVIERREQKDLDFVQAVFANNVHVNVKRTPFEKGSVGIRVRFGGGLLDLPDDKPGLNQLADAVFILGGLEAHTMNELQQIIAGKNVGLRFSVADDAFQFFGDCTTDDLELQLQLYAAYLKALPSAPKSESW